MPIPHSESGFRVAQRSTFGTLLRNPAPRDWLQDSEVLGGGAIRLSSAAARLPEGESF